MAVDGRDGEKGPLQQAGQCRAFQSNTARRTRGKVESARAFCCLKFIRLGRTSQAELRRKKGGLCLARASHGLEPEAVFNQSPGRLARASCSGALQIHFGKRARQLQLAAFTQGKSWPDSATAVYPTGYDACPVANVSVSETSNGHRIALHGQ